MSEQLSYYSSPSSTEANSPQPSEQDSYYSSSSSTEASNPQSSSVTIPHPPYYPQPPIIGKYIQ